MESELHVKAEERGFDGAQGRPRFLNPERSRGGRESRLDAVFSDPISQLLARSHVSALGLWMQTRNAQEKTKNESRPNVMQEAAGWEKTTAGDRPRRRPTGGVGGRGSI